MCSLHYIQHSITVHFHHKNINTKCELNGNLSLRDTTLLHIWYVLVYVLKHVPHDSRDVGRHLDERENLESALMCLQAWTQGWSIKRSSTGMTYNSAKSAYAQSWKGIEEHTHS